MKLLQTIRDLETFQTAYEASSGLELPFTYLQQSKVYAFVKQNKMIGGFILGSARALRTIDVFVSKENRSVLNSRLRPDGQYCEVCCFWIHRKFRKSKRFSLKCWSELANTVHKHDCPFVLFGTNSRGLARMYGAPKNAMLCHKDRVKGKTTYVFAGYRSHFKNGVRSVLLSKIFRWRRTVGIETNQALLKQWFSDVLKSPNPVYQPVNQLSLVS